MKLSLFDYHLPKKLIAQKPIFPRDHSKLMVQDRKTGKISHHFFYQLPNLINDSYILVFNNTKVLPWRIYGKKETGGRVEILFLRSLKNRIWEILIKSKVKIGTEIILNRNIKFKILDFEDNVFRIKTNAPEKNLEKFLSKNGHTPLPLYIHSQIPERKAKVWYQSIFAQKLGSVAAPTTSFHFTQNLLKRLKIKNIETIFITLHIGFGTFSPIKTKKIEDHKIHQELMEISKNTAHFLNQKIKESKKILAVGTTVARALESATKNGKIIPFKGETKLFIYPPYKFKIVDSLITNLHLPKSSLLCLVSAFASRKRIMKAYREAIAKKYRFYSFGDAMLIL